VARWPFSVEHAWVNALAIVSDSQPKPPFVIVDFHFDELRLRVPACISQGLGCNSLDFVSQKRIQVSWRAFHLDTNIGAIAAALIASELFRQSDDGRSKIAAQHGG